MYLPKKKIVNIRPAVIITAGLIIGILSAYTFMMVNAYFSAVIFCFCIVLSTVITAYFFLAKRKVYAVTFLISTIFILIGATLFLVSNLNFYSSVGNSNFLGVVSEIFSETKMDSGYNYSMILKGDFLSNENASVYISIFSTERIFEGSKIALSGYFSLIEPSDFTISTNAFYSVIIEDGSLVVGEIEGVFNVLKHRLLSSFEISIKDTSGLNYGVITGNTCYAGEEVLSKYQNLGIAHVFAVSGLHVGLFYFALSKLFKVFFESNKISFALITVILYLYVGFCGFTASAIRAFIIITVRNFAKLLGQKSDSSSNIALSAFIVLIVNPSDLLSAGFLLSYSVYSGLVLLTKPFAVGIGKILPKRFSNILAPGIVALVVSFPILIDFFGYASPFSFLFNLAIIPCIAFIFPFLLLSSVLLLIFPSGIIFGVVPNLFFTIIEFLLSFINTEAFMVSGINFYYSSVAYYLFFYLFAKKFNFSKKTYLILHIITLCAFILFFAIINL